MKNNDINLSAVVLVKDEEEKIVDCIDSLKFADEVIIIDDFSEDRTIELVERFDVKVYKRKLDDDFAEQRNFGLKKAFGKWVLFIDADERVGKNLRDEIIQAINNPLLNIMGYYIRRQDFFMGKDLKHGETASVKLLRLARKNAGKWERKVHETWQISGKTALLNYAIKHHSHTSLREFISSINKFSSLHAQVNFEEGKKSNVFKIIFWPIGHFIKNWIFRIGFADGTQGFIMALVMALHSFLAWSKLFLLQNSQIKR